MDIYIKPAKKIAVAGRDKILIQDLAEIVATKDVSDKIKTLELLDIKKLQQNKHEKKSNYLVSVTDIVKAIKKVYPDYTINNLGEMDTIVEYKAEKSVDNIYLKWAKIVFVVVTLLVGSATAIMSFHTDSQLPKVLENFYYIIFNSKTSRPLILQIPYSLGLAAGIIVFYNHFIGIKITDDPTPIEVEMTTYEKNVQDTVIDTLSTEKLRMQENNQNGSGS